MLESIQHPRQLRRLSIEQLEQLAQEIRETIVSTVSVNGGHLASSLGVVELTLALYLLMDWDHDKVVWDVGHQTYPHKLLTGRYDRFSTLRKLGGISGFPRPCESPFDHFLVGHSSTSISAALGMALARDRRGDRHNVVAVIGDGSLTGGLALEAFNHAGHLESDLLVILNDNDLSIAPNTGAYSDYLTRLRTHPAYNHLKKDVANRLQGVMGGKLYRKMDQVKDAVKHMTVIGGRTGGVFEELGFTYIGPVDGHDLRKLIPIMEMALSAKGPVLLHVGTKKGKGYEPAEKNPVFFHGVGPFDKETGEVCSRKVTNTKIFSNALVDCAERDARVVAVTAAMPDGTGLKEFSQKFPHRYYDVGICEQHAVTLAAGLASAGLRPVVAIYSTFMQRAYDQVIHDVCLQGLPVTLVLDRAGLVGEDGPTHHGAFDLASMRIIPGLTILAPAHAGEIAPMLEAALNHDGPVAIRYPRGAAKIEDCPEINIGEAQIRREGRDLLLLAVGHMVECADQAADLLAQQGVSATVVNVRTVTPFDPSLLELAKEHHAVLTLEEGVPGGFGSAFLEKLAEQRIMVPFQAVTLPADFVEHGAVADLREIHGLTPSKVCEQALSLLPVKSNA